MPRLTILMGAPGSGKSTWARGAGLGEVVSTEGARVDPTKGREVMSTAYKRIHELLAAGEDAVFDCCAARPSARKAALGIARQYGAPVECRVFETPVEQCIEVQRQREHPVPEDVVRRYHDDITRQIPGLDDEGFHRIVRMRRRK